ncbi:MAG: hypothetical protein ACHQHO_03595 [Solirubrobacterales bacterium]
MSARARAVPQERPLELLELPARLADAASVPSTFGADVFTATR